MREFEYESGTRLVFGAGALTRLGGLAAELGAGRVLVVTDPGIAAAGILARAVESLAAAGLDHAVFDGVEKNPGSSHVESGRRFAGELRSPADFVVALGGGSAMDCAKGINFLLTNGGRIEDYRGDGKAKKPLLPAIGVPTTAGTGSEAQRFALIGAGETGMKMACGDRSARFRAALLDPELTATAPREVAATAAVDAVSHAVESFVSATATRYRGCSPPGRCSCWRPTCAKACAAARSRGAQACCSGPTGPAPPSRTRCWGPPTPAPTR